MPEFLVGGAGLPVSIVVFAAAAVVVWGAGSRLAGYAARFATATGLGGAVVGLVLLGGITSLPEIATSITAVLTSGPALAVNNLLGGVSFQLVVLAIVDLLIGRQALTSRVTRADVLAYGAMNVILLSLAAIAVTAGDVALFGSGIGVGSAAILGAYVLFVLVARSLDREVRWRPSRPAAKAESEERGAGEESLARLGLLLTATGAVILAAGYVLTRTGEALAGQTGLGTSFFGAVFLAGATSLPELSSAWAAVKLGRPQLALGDVFGGNLFDVALIALVDLVGRGAPAMAALGPFSATAAMLGALLSGVLIIGMVERQDRTVLNMGYDSAAVLALYLGGLALLYSLRGT